jgi:hypothetical protein
VIKTTVTHRALEIWCPMKLERGLPKDVTFYERRNCSRDDNRLVMGLHGYSAGTALSDRSSMIMQSSAGFASSFPASFVGAGCSKTRRH